LKSRPLHDVPIGKGKPLDARHACPEFPGPDIRAGAFFIIDDQDRTILELDHRGISADDVIHKDVFAPCPAVVEAPMEGCLRQPVGKEKDPVPGPQKVRTMPREAERLRHAPGPAAVG
jgi:hypothetical protein